MLETLLSYDDADEKSVLCLSRPWKHYYGISQATHANRGPIQLSRYFEGGKK